MYITTENLNFRKYHKTQVTRQVGKGRNLKMCVFIYFIWLLLSLCCCAWASPSCGKRVGPSLPAGLLWLQSAGSCAPASAAAARGLSSCRAQAPCVPGLGTGSCRKLFELGFSFSFGYIPRNGITRSVIVLL